MFHPTAWPSEALGMGYHLTRMYNGFRTCAQSSASCKHTQTHIKYQMHLHHAVVLVSIASEVIDETWDARKPSALLWSFTSQFTNWDDPHVHVAFWNKNPPGICLDMLAWCGFFWGIPCLGPSFQLNKRLLYETSVNLSRFLPDLFDMSEWHSNTPGKSSGNVTTKDLDTDTWLVYIYTPLSIYLPIYPSIHLSIHPSIHLSIYLSLSLSTYL